MIGKENFSAVPSLIQMIKELDSLPQISKIPVPPPITFFHSITAAGAGAGAAAVVVLLVIACQTCLRAFCLVKRARRRRATAPTKHDVDGATIEEAQTIVIQQK